MGMYPVSQIAFFSTVNKVIHANKKPGRPAWLFINGNPIQSRFIGYLNHAFNFEKNDV